MAQRVGNLCPLLVCCRAYSEIVRSREIKDGRSWITSSAADVAAADFGAAVAAEPAFAAGADVGIAFAGAGRVAAEPAAGRDSQGRAAGGDRVAGRRDDPRAGSGR